MQLDLIADLYDFQDTSLLLGNGARPFQQAFSN